MTATEVMQLLESYGDANTKKTFMKHGAKEPLFGVRIGDLKKILAKTKKNHELSLALYQTGNSDAMYLAGLMADEKKITAAQLDEWISNAYWEYLHTYAVPWVAAETALGFEIGMKWLKSPDDNVVCGGWATLSNYAAVTPDEKLDIAAYSALLDTIGHEIHQAPNLVRYNMNGFIQENRDCQRRYERDGLQSPLCRRLYPKKQGQWQDWQEKENGAVLMNG
jgi:3-methyladenine DNA glycosylase AlkD